MLIYLLVIALALASLLLFLSAFFLPKLHRRDDFFWGSVGLFYALNLWVCRESFRGGILLGQVAATALLLSFGWQLWRLRVLNPESGEFSLIGWISGTLFSPKQAIDESASTVQSKKSGFFSKNKENQEVSTNSTQRDDSLDTLVIEEITEPDSLDTLVIEEITEPDSLDTLVIEEITETDSLDTLVIEEITEPDSLDLPIIEEITETDLVIPLVDVELPKDLD
jgi:hypothetical protein